MIEQAKKPSHASVPLKEIQNVDDAYLKLLHHPAVFDDERCSFAKGDTSVWASLKVIHSTLWCFTNVHKEKKGEEIMQSFSAGCYREREGVFITGNMGSLYFSFHQKWSKLDTLVNKDAKEAEMKKKFKIFDSAPSYQTQF